MKKAILFLVLVSLALFFACEIVQVSTPTSGDLTVADPAPGTTATTGSPIGAGSTITLEPANVEIQVGHHVNVKVIVTDEYGVETQTGNISVNVIDKTILALTEIDHRMITFEGVAPGQTSAIISASGLQTALVATVED